MELSQSRSFFLVTLLRSAAGELAAPRPSSSPCLGWASKQALSVPALTGRTPCNDLQTLMGLSLSRPLFISPCAKPDVDRPATVLTFCCTSQQPVHEYLSPVLGQGSSLLG